MSCFEPAIAMINSVQCNFSLGPKPNDCIWVGATPVCRSMYLPPSGASPAFSSAEPSQPSQKLPCGLAPHVKNLVPLNDFELAAAAVAVAVVVVLLRVP